MNYIFFVSRELWPAFNSIYALMVLKGTFPDEFIALYTDEQNMVRLESMLKCLIEEYHREIKIRKIRISSTSIESVKKTITSIAREGDIIDITGARKMMILSLMPLHGIRVTYLQLRDMRYSGAPFMMRPLGVQEHMEVRL